MKTKRPDKNPDIIIASKRDADVFFGALMNPPKPNEALQKAVREYKEKLKNKL